MTVTQPPFPTRKVVLVGASIRAAAQSAQRGGFQVIGIDQFGDRDTRAACSQFFLLPDPSNPDPRLDQDILRACDRTPVLVVGGLNQKLPLVDRLISAGRSLGQLGSHGRRSTDTERLSDVAKAAGILFPQTFRSPPSQAELWNRRWLRKRYHSSGGLGVRWWKPGMVVASDEFIQSWVPGRSFGASFLSCDGVVQLIGVCRSLFTRKGERPFIYKGSLGPIELGERLLRKLQNIGSAIANLLPVNGLFNVDIVIDRQDQVWLLEVNRRWSASCEVIEQSLVDQGILSTGESLLGMVIERSLFDSQPSCRKLPDDGYCRYIKRILYARSRCRFQFAEFERYLLPRQSLHDIPTDGTVVEPGQPLMTLMTKIDPNRKESMLAYRRALREIG